MTSTPPDREPRFGGHSDEGKVAALVTWALYILSIPSVGILVLIGLVVAYAARGNASNVARQHIDAQIRLFWSTVMWTIIFSVLWLVSLLLSAVLIGAFVIGFLSDGLVLVGVSTFWQIAIKGAVIILAVMLDQAQQRITRSKNAALAAANKQSSPPQSTPATA